MLVSGLSLVLRRLSTCITCRSRLGLESEEFCYRSTADLNDHVSFRYSLLSISLDWVKFRKVVCISSEKLGICKVDLFVSMLQSGMQGNSFRRLSCKEIENFGSVHDHLVLARATVPVVFTRWYFGRELRSIIQQHYWNQSWP